MSRTRVPTIFKVGPGWVWHSAGVSAPSGVVTFLFTDVEGVNPSVGERREGDAGGTGRT